MTSRTRSRPDVYESYLKKSPLYYHTDSYPGKLSTSRQEPDEILWYVSETNSMNDHVTDDYYKIVKAKGNLPNNPMTKFDTFQGVFIPFETSFKSAYTYYISTSKYSGMRTLADERTVYGNMSGALKYDGKALLSDEIELLVNQSVTSAYAKMNKASAEILVSIAEASKSVMTVARAMFQGAQLFASLRNVVNIKHGNTPRASVVFTNVLDSVSDIYLSIRYGWRPLSYEVADISTAIADTLIPLYRKKYRKSAKRKRTVQLPTSYGTSTYNDIKFHWKEEVEVEIKVRTSVVFQASRDAVTEVQRVWGVGHIGSTIYELVPGSFILDWFFNFNSVIRSWEVNPGFTVISNTTTTEVITTTKKRIVSLTKLVPDTTSGQHTNTYSGRFSDVESVTKVIHKERFNSPGRVFLPSFENELDFMKVFDLAAIGFSLARTSSHNLNSLKI